MAINNIVTFESYDGNRGFLGGVETGKKYDAYMVTGRNNSETTYLISEDFKRIFRVLNDSPEKVSVKARELTSLSVKKSLLNRIFGKLPANASEGL